MPTIVAASAKKAAAPEMEKQVYQAGQKGAEGPVPLRVLEALEERAGG